MALIDFRPSSALNKAIKPRQQITIRNSPVGFENHGSLLRIVAKANNGLSLDWDQPALPGVQKLERDFLSASIAPKDNTGLHQWPIFRG
jgi:hypothetical protein